MTPNSVTVTQRAADRICQVVGSEPSATPALRVSVEGGGCSGFQYIFAIVAEPGSDDIVLHQGNATVVIDPISLPYLEGSQIDFVDDLMGASFKITNPNATASCGCGTSFTI